MNLLVIGDSYAAGVGAKKSWLDLLSIPKEFRYGIPGSTAAEWGLNKGGRLTEAEAVCSNAVLISLLGNDALNGKPGNVDAQVAAGIKNLSFVVGEIKRSWTGVFLYADPYFGKNAFTKKSIPLANNAIKMACAKYKVVYIPLTTILDRACFSNDIHPNDRGQRKIAVYLSNLLAGVKDIGDVEVETEIKKRKK